MATNTGLRSLHIEFTQTRRMRSLKIPIHQAGALWLDYSTNRFRWQTGSPPETIVVRRGPRLFIIRPAAQKYEIRPFDGSGGGASGMTALAGGFPRSLEEFRQKYSVQSIRRHQAIHRIVTKPRGAAGRGVDTFTFVVGADDYRLRGMEIALEDGSSVETVFQRVVPNASMGEKIFAPPLGGFHETNFRR